MKRPITIAVLGAGYWGTKLCREYASIVNESIGLDLRYIADPCEGALTRIRADLSKSIYCSESIRYVSDFREALKDPDVDAVHIAIPNEQHYHVAREVLEEEKHVLLEKPMAMSSRESFKLARLAEEKGLTLQVGHIFRFNNAVRKVRSLIRQATIGRVLYLNLSWATFMTPPKDTDIIFDLAPHPIDILNYLLDEWPTSVHAIGHSYLRHRFHTEEVAMINMVFPDEVLANVYVSWLQHGAKERTVRIIGDKATVYCDALAQNVVLSSTNPDDMSEKIMVESNNTIRDMQLHFLERIRGRGPQFNSAMVGANTVRVLESIAQSMRRNDGYSYELPLTQISKSHFDIF